MHLGKNRTTAYWLVAIVLVVLAMGCSNDNSIKPTSPVGDSYLQSGVLNRSNSEVFTPADLGAPAEGIVVEGVSVPGIALGYTRAQVEAAYGDPIWCQNVNGYDQGSCAFPVEGGGQVDVRYRGADGGPASNSPDDVVFVIRWYESVPGWVTTAGITTTLAAENPNTVIAAYPNAEISYNSFGGLYSVIDYQQGIQVLWVTDFYTGRIYVYMSIMFPGDPPPPPDNLLRVTDIDMTTSKVKGKRQIQAFVRVENERGSSISGATVSAHWTFPDGSTQAVENATYNTGYAYFPLAGIPRGNYSLTVDNVELEDYTFDIDNSVLSAGIYVN